MKMIAAFTSVIVVAIVGQVVTQRGREVSKEPPVSKLILAYDGPLEGGGEEVSIRVFTIRHFAKDMDDTNFMQNKIELTTRAGRQDFRWPSAIFSAAKCELIDIDGDGKKEFVFIAAEDWARVVAVDKSGFVFRTQPGDITDEFLTSKPMEFRDLDGDGLKDFAGLVATEIPTPDKPVEYARVIKKWTLGKGFYEVKPR